MARQLRIYRLVPNRMDEFLALWRDHIVPAREAAGFTVEGAWVNREEAGFVWVLSYDGPNEFDAATQAYYDSDARRRIRPDPTDFIAESSTAMVDKLI